MFLFVKTPGSRIADLEGIMLSEINQRKTNCMISITCGIWKTKQTKQKQTTDTQSKPVVARGVG